MSGWSGHNTIDPVEIEARFAVEDSMAYLGSIFTEPSEESLEMIEKVKGIMAELPPREADFVDLYFFRQLRQTDIATIFAVSQPTVCYRLQRATSRIKYLLDLPDIDLLKMRRELLDILSPLDVQIVILMFKTTCQSEVATQLDVSQGLVRHRFLRAINIMRKAGDVGNMPMYADVCQSVSQNLNILREIPRADSNLIVHVIH